MAAAHALCCFATAALSASTQSETQRPPVPAAAEAAAGAPALRALVEHLLRRCDGSVARAQDELATAADRADEPVARYALLRQAIAVAERRDHAIAALAAVDRLAAAFDVDADAVAVALLRRMGEGAPAARVGAALAGMHRASSFLGRDEGALRRYREAAVRAAALCAQPRVYDFVAARGQALEQWHALARAATGAAAEQQLELVRALALGAPLPPLPVTALQPWLQPLPADVAATLDGLDAGALASLGATANHSELAAALGRAAIARAARWLDEIAPAERAAAVARVVAWTTRLATASGVHALRFRGAADLEQLAIANGAWRVADGLLEGACTGTENFATHRLGFRDVRAVVVRGGIRSDAGLNFRCKVGDVNLLLNWEVQPQNHLWVRGSCTVSTPPLLRAGTEHCVLFLRSDDGARVYVDGELAWTAPGATLDGTITVYPALGSAIFVREILVDGDPEALVAAPVGELK
jgi:hypothetical protein